MKRLSPTIVATGAATVLVAGLVGGWCLGQVKANRDIRSLALTHELEATGLCANGLKLENSQRPERLVMLLEQRLDLAVQSASELVDEGARLPSTGAVYMKDSVRRAAEYYATQNDTGKKATAETLFARLNTAQ